MTYIVKLISSRVTFALGLSVSCTAHHIESNHLDERYHEALCNLGAKLTSLALTKPAMFRREINKDYTTLEDPDLQRHLAHHL